LDEVVQSVAAAPPFARNASRADDSAGRQGRQDGIPPVILFGGLAAALALFLAVIFFLPQIVKNDAPGAAEESVVRQDSAQGGAEAPDKNEPASIVMPPVGSDASFNENAGGADASVALQEKAATDEALGDLLSQLERLRYRAIDRWGGQDYLDAVDVYAEGDRAYVGRNYRLAGERYRTASKMLEPFFDRIGKVFEETLAAAKAAFEAGDHSEAIRLFDLAKSITPGNREAEEGFVRATNLEAVLSLMEQGAQFEEDLELNAAKLAFEKALELDKAWKPAADALARVKAAIKQLSFEQRMTEGFGALAAEDFDSARAAFNAAKALNPSSRQPADGLLQLDQAVRLFDIRRLEREASVSDGAEQWETSVATYEDILKIDPDLQFAQEGLSRARSRAALHAQLNGYIADPDTLSDQVNMQSATNLLLELSRMDQMGPRLEDQKNELSRLLKRAATPMPVRLVSDNMTNVAVFKVGQFGTFRTHELNLRPGNYVAVGIRPGYRDVRVEFRVAPESDMEPIVIQCEEQI
jgi:tetratricopeptide (TPR) repeat protein